mmetsp:Transcript_77025/g.220633  ORF Transcript_77025/g.220633 Transcript_77025/m.220633 type:complete len:239 (-) Transcript_77025:124-840(-)
MSPPGPCPRAARGCPAAERRPRLRARKARGHDLALAAPAAVPPPLWPRPSPPSSPASRRPRRCRGRPRHRRRGCRGASMRKGEFGLPPRGPSLPPPASGWPPTRCGSRPPRSRAIGAAVRFPPRALVARVARPRPSCRRSGHRAASGPPPPRRGRDAAAGRGEPGRRCPPSGRAEPARPQTGGRMRRLAAVSRAARPLEGSLPRQLRRLWRARRWRRRPRSLPQAQSRAPHRGRPRST